MLTLNSTLQTAQDGQAHKPIISLTSSKAKGDLPFVGQKLNPNDSDQLSPNTFLHSSGRLIGVYVQDITGVGQDILVYTYSDVDRTVFNHVEFPMTNMSISYACVCEIDSSNVGIIFVDSTSSTVYYKIVSVTGSAISQNSIFTYSGYFGGICVVKLATGDFWIIYVGQTTNYEFRYRSSSNFTSWGSESILSIGGISMTMTVANPYALLLVNDDLMLLFDREDQLGENSESLKNVYYSISQDDGSSWGNAVKLTTYDSFLAGGIFPTAAQCPSGDIYVGFTERRTLLSMGVTGKVVDISIDDANHTLYVRTFDSSTGLIIYKIDIDTWTILDTRTSATTPATPSWHGEYKTGADGWIVPMYSWEDYGQPLAVYDGRTGSITYYYFYDDIPHSVYRNAKGSPDPNNTDWHIYHAQADAANNRVWLLWGYLHGILNPTAELSWGYIDLGDEPGTDGLYPFNSVSNYTLPEHWFWNLHPYKIQFYFDEDLLIYSAGSTSSYVVDILSIQSGARLKHYVNPYTSGGGGFASFPVYGVKNFAYKDGILYCAFSYTTDYNNGERRGLFIINTLTDEMNYIRPNYVSVDDYLFGQMTISNDGDLWIVSGLGLVKFKIDAVGSDEAWTLFSNDNIAGFTCEETIIMDPPTFGGLVLYDEFSDVVYFKTTGTWYGCTNTVRGMSSDGTMDRNFLISGTVGSWNDPVLLVNGLSEYDPAVLCDPDGFLYAFWISERSGPDQIYWDKMIGAFDLAQYLVKGREVIWHRTVDDSPAELSFSLARGDIFDVHNIDSIHSIILKKGRKINLSVGENIDDVDYLQPQGIFIVVQTHISYERMEYPIIEVVARDIFDVWADYSIIATEQYDTEPSAIISDLVGDFTSLAPGDIDIDSFGSVILQQWLDTNFLDILFQICDRFGYYPRIDVNGDLTVRKIADDNPVDHSYTSTTKLINFTPDDLDQSNHVCRVIVMGYERDYTEIAFSEERIKFINGTVGWWGFKKDYTVYYSDDKSRTCINPRLVKIESSMSIGFEIMKRGGISEDISYEDPDHKFCVVTVKAPNLVKELEAAILALFVSYFIPDLVSGTITKRVGSYMSAAASWAIAMILGSVGNFQFEVWAQPIGKLRRSIQGTATDDVYANELNMEGEKMVTSKIEDPLCYSASDCREVAEHEIMVARLQRNRVSMTKIAHLQDEDGDTIEVIHPISGKSMRIFITGLTRKLLRSDELNDGHFIDEIEGWNLSI